MAETVQQLLRELSTSDAVGVRCDDETWTWREHCARAAQQAATLVEGFDAGRPTHVGALLGNTPQMLEAMAAAGLGGYVLCGINDTRRGSALLQDLVRSDCQVLLVDTVHRELLDGIVDDLDEASITVVDVDGGAWAERLATPRALVPVREADATDTFMMIFTSGTSGYPKAVQVTHLLVVAAGAMLAERFGLGPADTCYVAMPLFHSNAVIAGWAVAAAAGAAIAPARFSASAFLGDVRRYGATYMNYVGKPLAYVLASPEGPDDADNPLRVAFGNEASDRDIAAFARRFGCAVHDGFGSTENAVVITREPGTPAGSVGRGLDGVAVYDAVTLTECPPAQLDAAGALTNADQAVGELVNTTGAGFFSGYYNDPAADDERMRQGMYWSGDLAYRDVDGWIYLAGRTADWMRVDGENIATAPVERIVQRLPAVNQVAVYAVPDEHAGDQVMAALVLVDGAVLAPAEWAAFLDAQPDLSPGAWPRYVRLAPSLPSTATHKVLKRELARQGATAGNGMLWVRGARDHTYREDAGADPGRPPDVAVRS